MSRYGRFVYDDPTPEPEHDACPVCDKGSCPGSGSRGAEACPDVPLRLVGDEWEPDPPPQVEPLAPDHADSYFPQYSDPQPAPPAHDPRHRVFAVPGPGGAWMRRCSDCDWSQVTR